MSCAVPASAEATSAAAAPTQAATTKPTDPRTRALLEAPLLPTLLRLATPNVIGLFATTVVIGYDGFIVGRLGPQALAGVALVLPLSMLMMQMSAGAIGGSVAAAVARALGAGRRDRAESIARQALWVALAGTLLFMLVMLGFGRPIFAAMSGSGSSSGDRSAALDSALSYSHVLFGGALSVWLLNILAAIVRGSGRMLLPSLMLAASAVMHVLLAPLLVFGAGPLPGLGVAGAALSMVCSNSVSALVLAVTLCRGAGPVRLRASGWRLDPAALREILRVGAPSMMSPLLSNASIAAATALIGSYGSAALAGFGVAARLEYIMVPIAFGFGSALTTLVATNLGAGQLPRAERAAWVGSSLVAAITGSIGIAAALSPGLWLNHFSSDPAVLDFGAGYLHVVGACYGLFGFGLALYFASQGAARMFWPLVGSIARVVVVGVAGALVVHGFQGPPAALFAVIAAGFVVYALIIAGAIYRGAWRPSGP